ncbi:hypothetical protein BC827DRAFT_93003 [Russula dissimulans]|nr:hypothetical protein BC827DRAFT_93003 [Russula dissimulans]
MLHISHIASFNLEKAWKLDGYPLKGDAMDVIFFDPIVENRTATVLQNESWPISIVVKCEGVKQNEVSNQELRKYCPRSDFLISNSSLPRLLVEANSTSETSWPADLIRMLTTGAFIVRFANNFVSPFCQEKSFVLCAIFIWDNGDATRYTLYQQQVQNDEVVYYNSQDLVS